MERNTSKHEFCKLVGVHYSSDQPYEQQANVPAKKQPKQTPKPKKQPKKPR
jgi:hypothetical protein